MKSGVSGGVGKVVGGRRGLGKICIAVGVGVWGACRPGSYVCHVCIYIYIFFFF